MTNDESKLIDESKVPRLARLVDGDPPNVETLTPRMKRLLTEPNLEFDDMVIRKKESDDGSDAQDESEEPVAQSIEDLKRRQEDA